MGLSDQLLDQVGEGTGPSVLTEAFFLRFRPILFWRCADLFFHLFFGLKLKKKKFPYTSQPTFPPSQRIFI